MNHENIYFILCDHPYSILMAVRNHKGYDIVELKYDMDFRDDAEENKLLKEIPRIALPTEIVDDFDFKRKEIYSRITKVLIYKNLDGKKI